MCYGGIGVLGELLLLLGKEELTTPDMLLTNNWTWLGQHQVDKGQLVIVNLLHLEDMKLEILNDPILMCGYF